MADPRKKYTVQEVLNSALNTDADALKVDLEGANIAATLDVKLDEANDSVALRSAVESNISNISTNSGSIKTSVDGLETLIAATNTKLDSLITKIDTMDAVIDDIKANSDTLDGCISGGQLKVYAT